MDSDKNIDDKPENLKYIKTNTFGENNIPKCLEDVHKNCLNDYNNMKLKNYDLTVVEKNLHLLNNIFEKLYSSEYSGKTFNHLLVKLIAILRGKKLGKDFENITKNKEIKINIDMSLNSLKRNLDSIINYLNKDERKNLIDNLNIIKHEKCDVYCKKNDECKNKCNTSLNRFDILIIIIKIYENLKNKLSNEELKKILTKEIYEIQELTTELGKLIESKKDKSEIEKYKNEIKKYENKIEKYIPEIYNLKMESKSQIEGIIETLINIESLKQNYLGVLSKNTQEFYKNCIEANSQNCTDSIK